MPVDPAAPGLAAVALDRATRLGARHADFRLQHTQRLEVRVRDGRLAGSHDTASTGYGIRVLCNGSWGFAAGGTLDPDAVARVTEVACEVARTAAALRADPVELTPEPVHPDATWTSPYRRDPWQVPTEERVALLRDWSTGLLSSSTVDHVLARVVAFGEEKYYADTAGTTTTQRRIWVHPMVTAVSVDRVAGTAHSLRTLGPPVARGWEYLTGEGWDWAGELAALPEQLAEKATAVDVEPGEYDLVLDPTHLWLTIHESVGHATELDRALGYEAAFAGTTFATVDRLGELRYGSPVMRVTADRTTPYGLATVGYDDDGVAAQSWELIRDGVLVGYQADRSTAGRIGLTRSNGCAYADSFARVPVSRMANVSLAPAAGGPDTAALIGAVDDGIYVVGDDSFSIDMQRRDFQFTGQRCYRIRSGRVVGPVAGVAYQGSTVDFWRSLVAVGGPQTWLLSGASLCGKAQPMQLAAASHGCPSAWFRRVKVLNTAAR